MAVSSDVSDAVECVEEIDERNRLFEADRFFKCRGMISCGLQRASRAGCIGSLVSLETTRLEQCFRLQRVTTWLDLDLTDVQQ